MKRKVSEKKDEHNFFSNLLHFWPNKTGQAACLVSRSGTESLLVLNHQTAEPFSGNTFTPKNGHTVAPPAVGANMLSMTVEIRFILPGSGFV